MKTRAGRMVLGLTVAAVLTTPFVRGAVRMPTVFNSHMVLQRDLPIPVWGWADPGEVVQVKLGDSTPVAATAAADGTWSVRLPAHAAGGPLRMVVTGATEWSCDDILVGDVWLCSGQSNMQWAVQNCDNAAEEIAAAQFPKIRHFGVVRRPASVPQDDVAGSWQVCSPETVAGFTAVGYFFGRELHKELDVPIGLINSSWGGTRIEPWAPPVGFEGVPELADILAAIRLADPARQEHKVALTAYLGELDAWSVKARQTLDDGTVLDPIPPYPGELVPLADRASPQQQPTSLYNGMIRGVVPYGLRGTIWYQGESNHVEGMAYAHKKRALVEGWRALWDQGPFPFYWVQIAPYQYGNESPDILPVFWEAEQAALAVPNTGMVVIHDIGNTTDIHPRNKQGVGKRLSLLALAQTYGRQNLVYSGPRFRDLSIEGAALRVRFDHIGSGLTTLEGEAPSWFEMIGRQTDFVEANARIDGDAVVLTHPDVAEPMAVRFGWHKTAAPNLANREGLPAWPFRAGEVPQIDYLNIKVPEAAEYTLVYDLDLAALGKTITYTVDNRAAVTSPFDRIAYFLELKKDRQQVQYVYVSMDAFTDDIGKIGVPTLSSKARFQLRVANMTVISNVDGIVTGEGLPGGNIEFWPNNYGPPNQADVPNASAAVWDFGDEFRDPVDGYGCMQVHNHAAKQTVFAVNRWAGGATGADLGIGNSTGQTRDWTFVKNSGEFIVKRLRVLVRRTP